MISYTDAEMIKLFIKILYNCFGIKKNQLVITIRYFTGMNRDKCFRHWARMAGVPKRQIKMYYNDGGKRSRKEFGMCRLGVRKSGYLFKIVRCLIKNMTSELLPEH